MIIVTCVYKYSYRDIALFATKHQIPLVVFNKNDKLKKGEEKIKIQTDHFTLIDIPNFGRCDYGFLYYIIKYYHNLPDKILFTKANFNDQVIDLSNAIKIQDYSYLSLGKHVKFGLMYPKFDQDSLIKKGIKKTDIEKLYLKRDTAELLENSFRSYLTMDFYQMVFGNLDPPNHPVIQFGHGPCFVVDKCLILKHNIGVYQTLLETFYPDNDHWTKWEGHTEEETYLEIGKRYHDNLLRFWTVLFTHLGNYNVETDLQNYIAYIAYNDMK